MNTERAAFEHEVIERAWKDESFKADLMNDPISTLSSEYGANLPDGIEIEVLEETSNKAYLVLPVNPNELSESELDMVAGGVEPIDIEVCSFTWCSGADV